MHTAVKMVGYVLGLAAVFGAAVGLGAAVGPSVTVTAATAEQHSAEADAAGDPENMAAMAAAGMPGGLMDGVLLGFRGEQQPAVAPVPPISRFERDI